MTLTIPRGGTVVLTGDSITDAGRREDARGLGTGYAALVADTLAERHPDAGLRVVNTGISGNRVADLRGRWADDVLAHSPAVVSVFIGINDTWRRYDSDLVTSVASYEEDYRALLETLRDAGVGILLIEPFLLPVRDDQWAWREDLDPRIQVVRRLAAEFDAGLLAADGLFAETARDRGGPELLAPDGVHPTPEGHALLANAWLRRVAVA
ncbi:lipolytic protein G-D-S-L family [Beutenbergia cavernae DSM 12333]|uniref:Lipolytic protein G-D-S-L family n=1 Tax=Beutenbergia cavernae (strain ATCC BAA-8 / DSM 12333 / CCUG 43141 / JCM 11478 / NBRC 16432 / NCIMB 13614 / HKI 0122) TaxID=471853 RepID=C5C210_BEUC1|nr:SGNH/GDSL hydrolase family protein [Beutenbergia cavernae]ACQ81635.1 lipolytic protein G-D-S-L family [Beutenbergia cavernae DSM 12333]